jgi:hypothetical protein
LPSAEESCEVATLKAQLAAAETRLQFVKKESEDKMEALKRKIESLSRDQRRQRATNKELQAKNRELQQEDKKKKELWKGEILETAVPGPLGRLLAATTPGKKVAMFTNEAAELAVALRTVTSSQGYEKVRSIMNLPLPALKTLQGWISAAEVRPGFIEMSFERLRDEVRSSDEPAYAVIIADDLYIKKAQKFNQRTGRVDGFIDLGLEVGTITGFAELDKLPEKYREPKLATKCMVMEVVFVNKPLKIVIYTGYIEGIDGPVLGALLKFAICQLWNIAGVEVLGLTADGGNFPTYDHLGLKTLTVKTGNFTVEDIGFPDPSWKETQGRERHLILCLPDFNHMFKLIRNYLYHHKNLYSHVLATEPLPDVPGLSFDAEPQPVLRQGCQVDQGFGFDDSDVDDDQSDDEFLPRDATMQSMLEYGSQIVQWPMFEALRDFQDDALMARIGGNPLSRQAVDPEKNPMKTKFAKAVFSTKVAIALEFLQRQNHAAFADCQTTAKFSRLMHYAYIIFDSRDEFENR